MPPSDSNDDIDMDDIDYEQQGPLSDDHLPSFPASRASSPAPEMARRSREWPYELNLALAQALDVHEPFTAQYGTATRTWNKVKDDVEEVSGKSFGVDTIKKHAAALVVAHRKADAAAMRKSGATEDVDKLTEVMGHVVGLIDDANLKKTQKSSSAQSKVDLERAAGIQARNAAATGCVDREEWADITAIPGATAREKMAQRSKRKRSPSVSDSDKENDPAPSTSSTAASRSNKRQRRRHPRDDGINDIMELLEQQSEADRRMLATLKQEQAAFNSTLQGVIESFKTNSQPNNWALDEARRREDDARRHEAEERRREERREEREERREEQRQFMQMMAVMLQANKKD